MNCWICPTKMKATHAADDQGVDRRDQPFPELVEMLQKRHLSAGAVVVGAVLRRLGLEGPGRQRGTVRGPWRPRRCRTGAEYRRRRPRSTLAGRGVSGAAWRSADFCSSTRISSSSVCFSSFDARLNSLRLRPSDRPSSGSFRGPKMIRAITMMTMSSGMPMGPNIMEILEKPGGCTPYPRL